MDEVAGDRPADEIEISPEMIQAGVWVLEASEATVSRQALVEQVYRAMKRLEWAADVRAKSE